MSELSGNIVALLYIYIYSYSYIYQGLIYLALIYLARWVTHLFSVQSLIIMLIIIFTRTGQAIIIFCIEFVRRARSDHHLDHNICTRGAADHNIVHRRGSHVPRGT